MAELARIYPISIDIPGEKPRRGQRPHYENFGKRLIKSPKLYFLDTGLLCCLLQIRSAEELFHRAEHGAIFESFVIAEPYKNFLHRGEQPGL
jgi:predicted AAA+ superfamily ATPase